MQRGAGGRLMQPNAAQQRGSGRGTLEKRLCGACLFCTAVASPD